MTVLIVEDNLFWSARLRQSVAALGATPVVAAAGVPAPDAPGGAADVAVVNLAPRRFDAPAAVRELKARGVRVVGHAGHKEVDALAAGRAAGCDQVVSNGTLTFKLPQILGLAAGDVPDPADEEDGEEEDGEDGHDAPAGAGPGGASVG